MMKVGFKAATVMHEVVTKSVSKTGAKAAMKSSAIVAFKLVTKQHSMVQLLVLLEVLLLVSTLLLRDHFG